ncbi:MAG: heavy metal-associated domain-containing protein [Fluviicola sp.]|nr:MAG: heavy metal-associated domain-containing protein [Fluviicola sp.]
MHLVEAFFITLWGLTIEMAPYLLLGFLIAGLLNGVFSKDWLQRKMGKPGIGSSIKAALLGIPLPLCSCGVIPTGVSFHKQGASKGATSSFLISTPQTGVDSILVTYSLMGWAFAIVRPIIAFVTGVLGGIWADQDRQTETVSSEGALSCSDCEDDAPKAKQHWFDRIFRYAFVTFLQDISRWLVLGLVLATLITMFVPETLFTEYLSRPWLNMLIVLAASIPLYVCATASVPIAAALLLKGVSPGAALVFLMAGPATNVATLTVLWQTIGKKTTIKYLISIMLGAVGFGLIIDYALPKEWFTYFTPEHTEAHAHHILPKSLMIGSGILIIYLTLQAEILKFIPTKTRSVESKNTATTYAVEGMTCNHCVANVDKNLKAIDGVEDVSVDLQKGKAVVSGDVDESKIKEVIEGIGYTFKGKK